MGYLPICSVKPILEKRNPCSEGLWSILDYKSTLSVFLSLGRRVGEEKAVLGSGGKRLHAGTCRGKLGSLPWGQESPQFGKTSNPGWKTNKPWWATVLPRGMESPSSNLLVQKRPSSQLLICSQPQALVSEMVAKIHFKMCVCILMHGSIEKYWLFKVKNKYPMCRLLVFCLCVKTIISSVEAGPCLCSPRRSSGPLIRKKFRNTILYCPWDFFNLDFFSPWNPLSTRGDGSLSKCSEDHEQCLVLCPAQKPRCTCVNTLNQQCGIKIEAGPRIHLLCPVSFPLPTSHKWLRLQRSGMQQWEAVLHRLGWKSLSVFPS